MTAQVTSSHAAPSRAPPITSVRRCTQEWALLPRDTRAARSATRRGHAAGVIPGDHDALGIVLEARHVAINDIALIRVYDIEPYLDGRRAWLRAVRGGT
jgi:hypothetical protein